MISTGMVCMYVDVRLSENEYKSVTWQQMNKKTLKNLRLPTLTNVFLHLRHLDLDELGIQFAPLLVKIEI